MLNKNADKNVARSLVIFDQKAENELQNPQKTLFI